MTGQDRTGQDRTGQDRTGKDRTGQDRKGQDNNASYQKGGSMNNFTSFHDLMLSVQAVSNNRLPHSIDHFMESTLSTKTKERLLKAVNTGKLSVESIANAMILAGDEANHGSVERVEEYILRVLM